MQMGTQVIDHLVATMNEKELQQAERNWKQVHLSTVISKGNMVKGLDVPKYYLKRVKGKICTIREVVILPFGTTVVKGIMNLTTYTECMNVVVEPVTRYLEYIAMIRLMFASGIIVQRI